MLYKVLICLVIAIAGVQCNECLGMEDGYLLPGWGCHEAHVCFNETVTYVECIIEDGLVLDTTTGFCAPFDEANGDCAVLKDCTGVPNGRYPICELDCIWYFTCFEGANAGNTVCNPGLVFDFQSQLCNWEFNVCAPCGSKTTPECEGYEQLCLIGS